MCKIKNGAIVGIPSNPGNTLIIPAADKYGSPVTEIKKLGSGHNSCKFKSIQIPNTIKKIGEGAFFNCENLTEVHIPASVESIAEGFAPYCRQLEKITVDPDNPFYDSRDNCNAIIHKKTNTLVQGCKNTIIPQGVKIIGNSAFNGCKEGLESISIPESVKKISDFAFNECYNLKNITLPNGLQQIGKNAFDFCKSLETIHLPDSIQVIEKQTFMNCHSLEAIYIPDSVKDIKAEAFSGCRKILYIRIPAQVNIDNTTFDNIAPYHLVISTDLYKAIELRKQFPYFTEEALFAYDDTIVGSVVYSSKEVDIKNEENKKLDDFLRHP